MESRAVPQEGIQIMILALVGHFIEERLHVIIVVLEALSCHLGLALAMSGGICLREQYSGILGRRL